MANPMKKNFSLHAPRKADARVLDSIKHDVRKNVKRERKKPLPEGAGEWKFECRVGADQQTAEPVPLKDISSALDRVAAGGVDSVYIEIISVPVAQRERG